MKCFRGFCSKKKGLLYGFLELGLVSWLEFSLILSSSLGLVTSGKRMPKPKLRLVRLSDLLPGVLLRKTSKSWEFFINELKISIRFANLLREIPTSKRYENDN